jgi:4-hydroxybenzoate polyprenyltransferase
MKSPRSNHTPHPWLSLIRFPNLLTVPGDVLVGGLWGGAAGGNPAALLAAAGAAVLLYICGLTMNDWIDLDRDRAERPLRPLPSGRIPARHALVAAGLTATLALALLAMFAPPPALGGGLGLLGLIVFYNAIARRHPLGGALAMGACRAGSVLLGALAIFDPALGVSDAVISIAVALGIYIAAVTAVARHEATSIPSPLVASLPTLALGLSVIILFPVLAHSANFPRFLAVMVLVFGVSLLCGSNVRAPLPDRFRQGWMAWLPRNVPEGIGLWISLLLPLQAGWVIASDHEPWNLLFGFLLLIAFPLNRWLARKIPMS